MIRINWRPFVFALASISALAQSAPKLNSLSREYLQRGTKTEIKVNGENLASVTGVLISGAPGITGGIVRPPVAEVRIESTGAGLSSITPRDSKSIDLNIEIDGEASLNEREVRLVSPDGVSNPLSLRVTAIPEINSAKARTREAAQSIELPATLSGVIDAAAQSDFFRFQGKKGEHISAEVYAFRLGSRLDSSLAIYDKEGRQLARNEDAIGLDSFLDFEVPEDGEYFVELRDFRYAGGGDLKYRLEIGVLPHISRAFPFGGQRGRSVDLTFAGSNLDSRKLILNVASDAQTGRQELRASSSKGLSNPFPFQVSDLPYISESEPNSALSQADVIQIPVAINGRIGAKKDYDAFRFQASENQRIVFDVSAYRFGSPLDALLILTDATGNVLQRNDDNSGEDARIDYTFKTSGEYFIILEDLLGRGGEEFGYLLTIETPKPDFAVTLVRDTPSVRRGGRVPIRCEVNRMNGFDDAVTITAENLPAGVYAEPCFLPPGVNSGFLVLAAAEAAPGSYPLVVKGRARNSSRTAEVLNGDRPAKEAFLTVLEPAPFSVLSAVLTTTIDQNQTGLIDVMVERRNGFNGEIRISAEGFSAGRDPLTKSFETAPLTLKPGETRGSLSLKAKTDSEIGIRHIYLRGEAGNAMDYSPLIPIGANQIPFVLSTSLKKLIVTALPAASGSAASEAAFNAKVDRRDGFEGEIELKLEGVPPGVTLSLTNIAAKAKESAIKLVASEKAPTGTNVQLTLTGTGTHKDRIYRFQAPPVTLTINAPEAEEKTEPKLATKQ